MACMSTTESAPESSPPAPRPVTNGDVEIRLQGRAWAERDRMLIFVWTGEALLIDVPAKQRRASLLGRWFRGAKGGVIQAEVCYAGKVVVCCKIAKSGGVARFAL